MQNDQCKKILSFYSSLNSLERKAIGRRSLFDYAMLYNAVQEPTWDYPTSKFFRSLIFSTDKYMKDDNLRLYLLEAPPRTGKTQFLCNILIPYIIGSNKSTRIMIVLGSNNLRTDIKKLISKATSSDSTSTRDTFFDDVFSQKIITKNNRDWLTFKYPDQKNECVIFFTTALSTPPKGIGFNYMFFIDYMSSENRDRDAMQRQYLANLQGFITRVQHNPQTKVIVDNQRLSTKDLSAHLVNSYNARNVPYMRLTFPYIFDERTEVQLGENYLEYFDKGEFLTSRFSYREMEEKIAQIGVNGFKTEYQQNPEAIKGGLINRGMIKFIEPEEFAQKEANGEIERYFITTDTAFEDNKRSDYNVFMFWAWDGNFLYVKSFFREKLKGLESNKALYRFWKENQAADYTYVEEVTSTKELIRQYRNGFYIGDKQVIIPNIKTIPRLNKSKLYRVKLALPFIELGRVFLIRGMDYNETILNELEKFREDNTHEKDDIVDNVIDAVNIVGKKYINFEPQLH